MNYYNGYADMWDVCVGRQKVACGFCVATKKLQSNEKESFEKSTWPRSMLHKSNGQLILLPAAEPRFRCETCVNKGPGRGHHTQDASLAATVAERDRKREGREAMARTEAEPER